MWRFVEWGDVSEELMIKNIIFDLGGVIIDIDYTKTSAAFAALGARDFDSVYSQAKQNSDFDNFEIGKMSVADFRTMLRTRLDVVASDAEIDQAMNVMLFNMPQEKLDFVRFLREQHYKVCLFSNINEIHLPFVKSVCLAQNGFEEFETYFDQVYYSCRAGFRKPHPESFLALLKEQAMKPEETLFIDDTLQHVEGARMAGLHAVHLTRDKSMFDTLSFIFDAQKLTNEAKEESERFSVEAPRYQY